MQLFIAPVKRKGPVFFADPIVFGVALGCFVGVQHAAPLFMLACCSSAVAARLFAHHPGAVTVAAGNVILDAPQTASEPLGELVPRAP